MSIRQAPSCARVLTSKREARSARARLPLGVWVPLAVGALTLGCLDGGQSFDDGRDGLGKPTTTSSASSSAPVQADDDAGDPTTTADEFGASELDSGEPSAGNSDETQATSDDSEVSADPELDSGQSSAEDDSTPLDDTTGMTESASEPLDAGPELDAMPAPTPLTALENSTACLFRDPQGQVVVEMSHACLCPGTLSCTVRAEDGLVQVGAEVRQLEIPCPPACFEDVVQCSAQFDPSAGTFSYGDQHVEFTQAALNEPGGEGLCLTQSAPSLPVPTGISVADLCKQVALLEQGEVPLDTMLQVNLTGAVELEVGSTAIGCDDNCCNWAWGFYSVSCSEDPDDVILLTADGAPYGQVVAEPGPGMDDDFTNQIVTLGCQGPACDPVCAPAMTSDFGTATGEIVLLPDGFSTWQGEGASARAEFRISSAD